jgi:predicted porin
MWASTAQKTVQIDGVDYSKNEVWFKEFTDGTEVEYDKRKVTAEIPFGQAKLNVEGALGKEKDSNKDDDLETKYAQAALKDIPVAAGLTGSLSATALRNTTDWYKESKWAEDVDVNKFKGGLVYNLTSNMSLNGAYEFKRENKIEDEDEVETDTKTVEVGADYRLSLGALELSQGIQMKNIIDDPRQVVTYKAGAKTTVLGAVLDASVVRRMGKGAVEAKKKYEDDEEFEAVDTIWDLNLTYPVAPGVDFKLGGLYINHENEFSKEDGEPNYDFTVRQITAGVAVSF